MKIRIHDKKTKKVHEKLKGRQKIGKKKKILKSKFKIK